MPTTKPWKGHQRAAVVLLNWSDTPKNATKEEVEKAFFGTDAKDESLRQFLRENSAGKIDLTGEVFEWKVPKERFSEVRGDDSRRIGEIAWKTFREDVPVDRFDSDGSGKIDNLFVVHSGKLGTDRVGPDAVFPRTTTAPADNVAVLQAEGTGSVGSETAIGFYLHEGGHRYFGIPDLYGDHYRGKYGIGMWGMMGLGCWGRNNQIPTSDMMRYPAHFEPKSKVQMGWVTPQLIDRTTRNVTLRPVEETGDVAQVKSGTGEDYFLEFRSGKGFTQGEPGHGLLIWKGFKVIQADGRDDLNNGTAMGKRPVPPNNENFGDASDPFPGANNVTSYQGRGERVRFENIRNNGDTMTVDVVYASQPNRPATS